MAWHAIHVRTGNEDKVCEEIRKQLTRVGYAEEYQLLVPKRTLQEKRQGEWSEVVRIMFPGYVLVETDEIRKLAQETRRCEGVYRYLENEGEFQKVKLEEIAQIVYMTGDDGMIGTSEIAFEEKGSFEVIRGPLKGYEGCIKKLDRHKLRATVEFDFGDRVHEVGLGISVVRTELHFW